MSVLRESICTLLLSWLGETFKHPFASLQTPLLGTRALPPDCLAIAIIRQHCCRLLALDKP